MVYSVRASPLDSGVRGVWTPLYKPLELGLSGVEGRDPFAIAILCLTCWSHQSCVLVHGTQPKKVRKMMPMIGADDEIPSDRSRVGSLSLLPFATSIVLLTIPSIN
jgi:hypothetical protein